MKCLVTGANGLIGRILVERLVAGAHTVCATDVRPDFSNDWKKSGVIFQSLEILDQAAVAGAVRSFQPDWIFHLAAQSFPNVSWEKPALTFEVNVIGSANVFEAVRLARPGARVVAVCSSGEYAPVATRTPIAEGDLLYPSSPYAVSKIAEDHMARLYYEHYGLQTIRARPFYLIGPGKTGDMASDFARGIVAIERGEQRELAVGNLEVVRDLLDVRDGAAALVKLAEYGKPGEVYNICSGEGLCIRDVLEALKKLARVPIVEKVDPSRLRPIDEPVKIGNAEKLRALGWKPERAIQQTIKDILDYWRESR